MRKIQRKAVKFVTSGDSLTLQSDRTNADINNLVRRGIVPPDPNQLMFGDFADGSDFESVQQAIANAKSAFMELPSDVRDRFANNPAKLIDFVNDPNNAVEAANMGLINPLSPPEASEPEPAKGSQKEPSDASESPSGGESKSS